MRRGTISGIGFGLISRIDAMEDLKLERLLAHQGIDQLAYMNSRDIPGFYPILPRAHPSVQIIQSFCNSITSESWTDLLYRD